MAQAVTPSVQNRLLNAIHFQNTYFPEAVAGVDRVVISDVGDEKVYSGGLRLVRADLKVNGLFNLSRAKNVAFDLATREGYDWLYDADADRVLTRRSDPPWILSHVPLYWAKEGDGAEDLARRARARELHLMSGSFFVMEREVFTKVRFCEEFQITRWDDVDFVFNVCPAAGFRLKGEAGTGIHLWHSDRERCYEREAHNSSLYRKRQSLFSDGKSK